MLITLSKGEGTRSLGLLAKSIMMAGGAICGTTVLSKLAKAF